MSSHSDLVYVAHIRDAARKVIRFTNGLSFEDFLADELTQWAVIRGMEIIGEASTKISNDFVKQHPDFPWRHMRGMRNVLIHNYADVDLSIVWRVVQEELPELGRLTDAVLTQNTESSSRLHRRTPQKGTKEFEPDR